MVVFKKIIAVLMIVISIISLVISLFMIVQIWKNKAKLTETLVGSLTDTSVTLATTAEGLIVVHDTLGSATTSITGLADTTVTLADNVSKTSATIDSFSTLFGVEIPTTITNTQIAIVSAQQSAAVIDGVLLGLASVPLIGIDYDPEESLSNSLGTVVTSLTALPSSIKGIGDDLDSTGDSLRTLQTDILVISKDVLDLSEDLHDAQEIVEQYQEQISELQTTVDNSIDQVPDWINIAAGGLSFLILWLVVAQLGLLVQGIHNLTS